MNLKQSTAVVICRNVLFLENTPKNTGTFVKVKSIGFEFLRVGLEKKKLWGTRHITTSDVYLNLDLVSCQDMAESITLIYRVWN